MEKKMVNIPKSILKFEDEEELSDGEKREILK